jgi:hypothetical protein
LINNVVYIKNPKKWGANNYTGQKRATRSPKTPKEHQKEHPKKNSLTETHLLKHPKNPNRMQKGKPKLTQHTHPTNPKKTLNNPSTTM